MNLGITIGRKGKVFTVITTPEVPFTKQRRAFKDVIKGAPGKFDEVQMWSSTMGRVKRKKFGPASAVEGTGSSKKTTTAAKAAVVPAASPEAPASTSAPSPAPAPAAPVSAPKVVSPADRLAAARAAKKAAADAKKAAAAPKTADPLA